MSGDISTRRERKPIRLEQKLERIVGKVIVSDYVIPPVDEVAPYTYLDTPQAVASLDALAARVGLPPSALIRQAVRLLLAQQGTVLPTLEDYHESEALPGTAVYDRQRMRALELEGLLT
jgi:hypothetical protein